MTTTLVKRPARIQPPETVEEPLNIAPPPGQGQEPPALAGASMMMMPIMGGTGSITVAITQPGKPIVAVAAFLALIGSISIGVLMMISQKSGTKKQVRESRERYLDYIEALRHSVRRQIAGQRAEQAWRFPRTDELVDIARDDARRWERRTSHVDFLGIRLGTGDVPLRAGLDLDADTGPLNEFDPVCLQAAQELQQRYAVLRDQPITLPLSMISALSIVGVPQVRRDVAHGLVAQLLALQSPNDLSLALVRSDETADRWDWLKWSPHAQDPVNLDGDLNARRIESSVAAMQESLQAELETRLDRHQRTRGSGAVSQPSHIVVVVDGEGLRHEQHLVSPDPAVPLAALGVHVVMLLDERRHEPDHVDVRMTLAQDGSATLSTRAEPFTLDLPDPGLAAFVARLLSPLRLTIEDAGSDDKLTDTVGLPEILGVRDPAKLDLRTTWRKRALRDLLRVPIGVGTSGSSVMLDLKESAHGGMGPHGMVVGATGSGKSEMLRTLVSSLVIGHGPDRLALMLVDFKGGATFASMEHIPHMAGMITNLQDDLTLVDRMRDALFGEMQRRQEILKKAGNLPNVTSYQDRIDAGEDLEPLPHLLVIIDEFSELLTAKPDFADLFVAIGRIGRSIGVHLLLATQKLEMGKIRGLESHLSYRISLRTFSEAESRDAIGVPDAFHLPPEPGSGYLKVDTTVFERFKAALVSDTYVPPADELKTVVPVVPYVAVNGLGAWLAAQSAEARVVADGTVEDETRGRAKDPSVLDVLCAQIEKTGAAPVRPVWLDPLPTHLPVGSLIDVTESAEPRTCTAVLGLVDDPRRQAQFPLEWDFTGAGANLVLVGSPATGKSTLIRTMVTSMSARYAPGDVAFYVIDYGGGSLSPLARLPHVATVTSRVDPERIQRTVNDVRSTLNRREQLFRQRGIDSMAAFRRARENGELPDETGDVFLVVDGWGTFREEYDDLDYAVADLAARGANFGVHVVVTVTQGMQVRMRMMSAMGGRIELRMNDAYDSEFERKMMEQVAKDAPGRGLTGDRKSALIFQSALPALSLPELDPGEDYDDAHLQEGQRTLIEAVAEKWGDRSVAKVEILPTVVRMSDLPALRAGAKDLHVGLSEMNLGPAGISLLGTDPHLQVYGDAETGKTNMLKLLIAQLIGTRSPDEIGIAVIDYRRSLLDVVPEEYLLAYATTAEQAGSVADQLAASFRERLPGPDVTSEQLRTRTWWKGLEVYVIVDDYDLVSTSSGDPLMPFVDLLAQGRDLGFHLVLSRRTGGLSRAIFEPMIQRLIDISCPGFMFSGDRLEGRLIGGQFSRRLPKGRAMFVNRDGQASLVQTALVDESVPGAE